MGSPGAREATVAIGGETALLAHEAERGERSQPVKPLRRLRHQVQLAFLRTDDHIDPSRAVFDQIRQAGAGSLFCVIDRSLLRSHLRALIPGLGELSKRKRWWARKS